MWKEENDQLKNSYSFKDFTQAFAFMTEVAFQAERLGHHPDWHNVYNTVDFALNTHDAGGKVTEKDHKLAAAIDDIYAKYKT